MIESKLGRAALAEFSQLHGKDFDLVGGYVAHYGGAGSQATLWVAQAKDAPSANELVKQMAEKVDAAHASAVLHDLWSAIK